MYGSYRSKRKSEGEGKKVLCSVAKGDAQAGQTAHHNDVEAAAKRTQPLARHAVLEEQRKRRLVVDLKRELTKHARQVLPRG